MHHFHDVIYAVLKCHDMKWYVSIVDSRCQMSHGSQGIRISLLISDSCSVELWILGCLRSRYYDISDSLFLLDSDSHSLGMYSLSHGNVLSLRIVTRHFSIVTSWFGGWIYRIVWYWGFFISNFYEEQWLWQSIMIIHHCMDDCCIVVALLLC